METISLQTLYEASPSTSSIESDSDTGGFALGVLTVVVILVAVACLSCLFTKCITDTITQILWCPCRLCGCAWRVCVPARPDVVVGGIPVQSEAGLPQRMGRNVEI